MLIWSAASAVKASLLASGARARSREYRGQVVWLRTAWRRVSILTVALRTPGLFAGVSRHPAISKTRDRRRRCQRRLYGRCRVPPPRRGHHAGNSHASDGPVPHAPAFALVAPSRSVSVRIILRRRHRKTADPGPRFLSLGTGDDLSRSFGSPGKRFRCQRNNRRSSTAGSANRIRTNGAAFPMGGRVA